MLSRFFLFSLAFLASTALAQTWTSCNPLNETCQPDTALGTTALFNFTNAATADTTIWNTTAGTVNYELDGAEFTINGKGDSPTLQSNFYIFFGQVSVVMRAASGTGIVSSIVLQSDDLDEIDWEWIGGNHTHTQSNYFGKGNTTSYDRAVWHPVNDPQDVYHNYTTIWTSEKLEWWIDDNLQRTLTYEDATWGNISTYPQTPMNLRIGVWAGGDPTSNSNGTVEWAGGTVDYSKAPFTQTVQSVYVQDYSSGSTYTYGDHSGSHQSIKIASGNSTIAERLSKPRGVVQRWKALSHVAQIAIMCSALGVGLAFIATIIFCCIRNRRAGRKERAVADAEWEKEVTELNDYKRAFASEKEIHPRGFF